MTKHHMKDFFRRIFQTASTPNCPATRELQVAESTRATTRPDGIVLLNIDKGSVFTANLVGARIWKGITTQENLKTIANSVAQQYSIPVEEAETDIAEFVSELQSHGFLTSPQGAPC